MADNNNTVQYQISVTKTGDGAVVAAGEFKNLQAAAAAVTQSASSASSALHQSKEAAKLAGESVRVLNETCLMAGMAGFPQLGMAVTAVRSEMTLAREAAKLTGLSLGGVNVVVVGLVAAVGTGAAAWAQYKAELAETKSIADSFGTEDKIAARLRDQVYQLQLAGKLTAEQAESMNGRLANPSYSNLRSVQGELRPIIGDEKQIAAAERMRGLVRDMGIEMLSGFDKEREEAQRTFEQRMKELEALKKAAGSQMTGDQYINSVTFALGEKNTRLNAINLREEQQLMEQMLQEFAATDDAINELENEAKRDRAEQTAVMLREFEQNQTITALQSSDDRITIAEREYAAKMQFYHDLYQTGRITEQQLTDLSNRALIERLQNTRRSTETLQLNVMTMKQMESQAANSFASGFANAFVQFASGAKSAEDAFKQFAASFLQKIAEMIIEQAILNALQSAGGGSGGGSSGAAFGGTFFAADGVAGVNEVSTATFFPRFNVVAGEAGREMLTVLSKPRMMSVGGVDAVVGNAGNNRLAIADADALARRGGVGGTLHIVIDHTPETKAEIISTAVEGAELRVTQNLRRNTPLREAVRKAKI